MAEGTSITEEYVQQADELVRVLSDCPSEALAWRTSPAHWSITEIVSQLADAELILSVRIRRIITQDQPHLHGYRQEEWAQRLGYERQDLENVALSFTALRRTNGDLLDQLSYADWSRTGEREEGGQMSLFQLIESAIAQTAKHLGQVRAVAAEFAAQTNGRTKLSPTSSPGEPESPASGAKFYALALFAGLTILSVGFFMQSYPVYIFGGILSAIGVLLVLLAMLKK